MMMGTRGGPLWCWLFLTESWLGDVGRVGSVMGYFYFWVVDEVLLTEA